VKYFVLIGSQPHEVDVRRDGGGYAVTFGVNTFHVDVGTIDDGHAYSLLIEGRSVDVAVEERPDDALDLLIGGRRYATTVLGQREFLARGVRSGRAEGERTVRAVMTGIVRDVLVAPGDSVRPGQTLFILEAMKMENEVKAGVEGKVARVLASTGQTVTKGDVIVEIG